MKYVIVLGDGMADYPIEEIGGKTPIEYAKTETLDELSKVSEIGLVHTVPEGMYPGSDTANLSVIGYNPRKYYSGRSPLEALSIGVDMKPTDVSFRCNIVTLSEDDVPYEERTILDHSAGEISTEDAAVLIEAVKKELENDIYKFYVGTSYRHLMIKDNGEVQTLKAPHDILTKVIGEYLPEDEVLRNMMKKSYDILVNHPINVERKKKGLNPANSIWLWGSGTCPALTSFEEKTGKKGVMISAVDLLKGIAVGAGMKVCVVPGANGGLDTNYLGKAEAACDELLNNGYDFAYIHVEAPDEMGHQGSFTKKVKSIECLDSIVIKTVIDRFKAAGEDLRMLVLPDHPTPISLRTHTTDSIPYLLYDSTELKDSKLTYCEKDALASRIHVDEGHTLIDHLFEK